MCVYGGICAHKTRAISPPKELVLQAVVSCLPWCWELSSSPLQEQYIILTAEPSLLLQHGTVVRAIQRLKLVHTHFLVSPYKIFP